MNLDACATAPENWQRLPIKDVCQRVTSGGTPSRKQPEFYSGGSIGWVKTKELQDGFINETEESITPLAVSSSSAKILPKDTVLLAMYGATVGMLGILEKEMTCNQACCAMLVKPGFDRDFLFYQLLAHRTQLQGLATGAAQQNLSGQQIKELVLPFPSLDEQRAIGSYLRTLDDRITLLRETNATLEAIAQALFKSWFVDFDPVRAKMEGRAPEGMDEATAALFPDSFEETELGVVPLGWLPQTFRETIDIIGGGTPKTSNPDFWNGTIPWFSVVDAPAASDVFVIDTEKHITKAGLNGSSTKLLPAGTTIISARGTVGRLALIGCPMTMNQSCYGLRGKAEDDYFTFFSTTRLVQQLQQKAHGSVFDAITQETFSGVHLSYPSAEVIAAFDSAIEPLMLRIRENLIQAKTLATLRDTLLPRLISGQLRLSEASEVLSPSYLKASVCA